MDDEAIWTAVTERVGVWRLGFIIVLVILIGFALLRMAMGPIADRRTRRLLEEDMKDDEAAKKKAQGNGPSSPDPEAPATKRGDGKPR